MWLQNCLFSYVVSCTSAGLSLTSCNVVFVSSFPWGFRPSGGPVPRTILASCRSRLNVWPAYSIFVYTYVRSRWMGLVVKNGEYVEQFSKIKLKAKRTIARLSLFKRGRGGAVGWALRYKPKVASSIPDGVIGIFHLNNPSGRTMELRSTQPLTEMSTRKFLSGKGGRCKGWQPYYLHVPIVLKFGSLILLEPSGPVQACNSIALPLPFYLRLSKNIKTGT